MSFIDYIRGNRGRGVPFVHQVCSLLVTDTGQYTEMSKSCTALLPM